MKTILLSLLFQFSLLTLYGQSDCDCYERLMQLAYFHYSQEDHLATLESVKKALTFKEEPNWSSIDYWMLTYAYQRLGNVEAAFQNAKRYIKAGGDHVSLLQDSLLMNFIGEEKSGILHKELSEYLAIYQSQLELDYLLRLERITGVDQAIRSYFKVDHSTFRQMDSLHFYRALALIEEYGFPERQRHGFDAEKIEHLLLHASLYSEVMLADILELLEAAQKRNLIGKFFIAQLLDRREVWMKQLPQQLGVWNSWKDRGQFGTLSEVDHIDRRRFDYNLLRLQEQGMMENRVLPEGYQVADYPPNYFCGFTYEK